MKFTLNQVKSALGEVQKTMNWAFEVAKAPAAGGPLDPSLLIRVQTTELPTPQIQHTLIQLGGHSFNNTGKVTKSGQIQITFIEGTDARVTSYFTNLTSKYWTGDGNDTQGNQAPTADLKGDYVITLLDGQNKTTQRYKLVGVLCTPSFAGQLGQDAQELQRSVTLDFDDFHIWTPTANW